MGTQQHNNLYGILFMLLNTASLATLYATMKFLTGSLSSNQVVFFYKFSILILIIPWVFKDGLKSLHTDRIRLHMLRGFLSIGGSLAFMYGLKYVDMIDATAVIYLEQVFLAIMGMLYFKEKVTKSKIFAVLASLLGAVIIVYPDIINFENGWIPVFFRNKSFNNVNYYYLFILLAVVFWTSNSIAIKLLGKTEKTKTQLFYVMLFSCVYAFPVAFMEWKSKEVLGFNMPLPTKMIEFDAIGLKAEHLKYIALLALCYFLHSVAFFKALKYAEISTVIPFQYTKLIFIGILGYNIFSEIPETNSYIGYTLIVSSGLVLVKSETKRRKKEKLAKQMQELKEEYEHA